MSRGQNVICEPSPVMHRPRNNAAIPVQGIGLVADLLGYWCSGFESHLPVWDESYANVLQLTASGAPAESAAGQGKFVSQSVLFDGASYLYRADEAALRVTGDVTFCAWVYPTAYSATAPIFCKASTTTPFEREYELSIINGIAFFFFTTPTGAFFQVNHTSPVALNQWTLIICHYDASTQTVGIAKHGGAPHEVSSITSIDYVTSGEFRIGGKQLGAPVYFQGRIQQVARWDRLLNLAERTSLMADSLLNMEGVVITAASDNPTYPVWETDAIPAAPTALSLSSDVSDQVDLSWICEAVNAVAIEIWRSEDGAASALYDDVTGWTDSYHDDDSDTAAHTYEYKIRAVNYAGASAFTSEVSSATGGLTTDEGTITTDEGTITTDES